MNKHLAPKTINLHVAYMDVAVRRIGKGREHMSRMDCSRTMQEQLSRSGSFVKLSNSGATPHREVPVPQRQDVEERPCVPRLDLNGPTLRHFESQFDSPRLNQRFPVPTQEFNS